MQDRSPGASRADVSPRFGFYGKIPARGDFVRSGLPRGFIDSWDDWLRQMMDGSRQIVGAPWVDAWMEAPIWSFRLPRNVCGPDHVMGVFMPSVDRAGRYFPLTIACVSDTALPDGWLATAQAAGLAALELDLDPDGMTRMLTDAPPPDVFPPMVLHPAETTCSWWTEGAPRVPAWSFATPALPGSTVFARMIDSTDHPDIAAPGS